MKQTVAKKRTVTVAMLAVTLVLVGLVVFVIRQVSSNSIIERDGWKIPVLTRGYIKENEVTLGTDKNFGGVEVDYLTNKSISEITHDTKTVCTKNKLETSDSASSRPLPKIPVTFNCSNPETAWSFEIFLASDGLDYSWGKSNTAKDSITSNKYWLRISSGTPVTPN